MSMRDGTHLFLVSSHLCATAPVSSRLCVTAHLSSQILRVRARLIYVYPSLPGLIPSMRDGARLITSMRDGAPLISHLARPHPSHHVYVQRRTSHLTSCAFAPVSSTSMRDGARLFLILSTSLRDGTCLSTPHLRPRAQR
jgi:hypothetical protein